MKDSPEANGGDFADVGQMISRGTDVAFDESELSSGSKSAAVLEKVQAILGCTMEEVHQSFFLSRESAVLTLLRS